MKKWGTIIIAEDPIDGKIKRWGGPNIEAPTKLLAIEYCQNNGLGYCYVDDEVVMEVSANSNDELDFENT